jgi:uncharacterized membrane protein
VGRRRRLHLALLLERARTSLWLVPGVMVIAAVALSTGLLALDERLAREGAASQWWLFEGNAEGARTLLSVIAGSLITVVSVAYSVTMIAIQQAATQYSPRVLRNYTKDRGNQVVLGIYVATFTYALLVLREVREAADDGDAGFVPTWSIFVAMLLALASLAALVYFMHHVSESMQVGRLLGVIRGEVDREIARIFPDEVGAAAEDPADLDALLAREALARGAAREVRAGQEGYLRRVDVAAIEGACEGLGLAVVPIAVGERVRRDTVVLRAWPAAGAAEGFEARVQDAFQLDGERSTEQDVLFGLRQMVDLALKALSPGVNDPTTAEQAIAELVGAVALLARRRMPSPVRRLEGGARLLVTAPTFERIVEEAFSQIRRAARSHLHVTLELLAGLRAIALGAGPARSAALAHEAALVLDALPGAGFTAEEEGRARRAAQAVLAAAGRQAAPPPG